MRFVTAAVVSLVLGGPSVAAEAHCMARMVGDAVALEAPEQVRSKANGNFGPITEIKVRKDSGRMYFCAHETYCYDSNAFELISACRIKRDSDMGDPASFSFFTR